MNGSLLRHSSLDALLIGMSVFHAVLLGALFCLPPQPGVLLSGSLGFAGILWWNANTVSHNHLHNPLFHSRWHNQAFSIFLTLLSGVPQTMWKRRHLWHHAGEPATKKKFLGRAEFPELLLLGGWWIALFFIAPSRFLLTYLPGYGLGMLLCQLQGHFEHAGLPVVVEPGISYYGRLYNLLWFNDGYHAEHHRYPGTHWSKLPLRKLQSPLPTVSTLPPLLRGWESFRASLNQMQAYCLVLLEGLALRPGPIQRFMLSTHERALARLLKHPILSDVHRSEPPPRIGIVGGGLFPRTALLLAKLVPSAHLTIIDECAAHVSCARSTLLQHGVRSDRLAFMVQRYCEERHRDFDLLVFPLGYLGDREALYRVPFGDPPRLIHDWFFRRDGQTGVSISRWIGKRLNLACSPSQVSVQTDSESVRCAS